MGRFVNMGQMYYYDAGGGDIFVVSEAYFAARSISLQLK